MSSKSTLRQEDDARLQQGAHISVLSGSEESWAWRELTLFCNVVPVRAIGIVVSTPEKLAQDRVVPVDGVSYCG